MNNRQRDILRAKRTGPKGKYPVMTSMLRERIISGVLRPGARLPPASDMQVEFTTTKATALRAIRTLVLQGYLRTEQRSGIYVAEYPPHISQFAVAFPWGIQHAPSQFFRAIQAEAAKLQDPRRAVAMFHDTLHQDGVDSRRLKELVLHHGLAGLILALDPYGLEKSSIMQEAGVPRVAITSRKLSGGIHTVYPDLAGFWERGLERLAAQGRRRVAVLMLVDPVTREKQLEAVSQRCARYGLETRAAWIHAFTLENAAWVKSVVQLLFQGDPAGRPDALLIADDNFVESATAGVLEAGVQVPRDLNIVAMANFPYPTPAAVPCERLGFEISRLVAVCMELIDRERRGEPSATHTAIPAIFQDEFSDGIRGSICN